MDEKKEMTIEESFAALDDMVKKLESDKISLEESFRLYEEGMKLVKDGGYFATCSCSHFMTRELFEKMLREAAREAHVRLRQIEARTQGPDHPILWTAAESSYLKFYIFQIIKN